MPALTLAWISLLVEPRLLAVATVFDSPITSVATIYSQLATRKYSSALLSAMLFTLSAFSKW